MFFFLTGFHQGIYNITQHMEWFVYITALFEPITLDFGLFSPFATG